MNNRTIGIIIASAIAIFVFLVVVYKLTNSSSSTVYPKINQVLPTDHVAWSPDKKNILVEYSDFRCPSCREFHNLLKQFEASQKVTLVYREFPLYQIHPNAMTAAYAAESAGQQGEFFPMADLLFNTQDQWGTLGNPTEYFVKLAQELGLDTAKFKSDINSQTVKNKVNDDLASGDRAGINATPTFFLNGKKLDNISSFEEFKKLLLSL